MDYTEEVIDNKLILHLDGNLDMLNAGILKERLMEAIQFDHEAIILDMGKVGFVDSSGFGLLIQTNDKLIKKSNRKLRIASVSRSVQQVFRISKIGEVLEIFETLDEAKS